MDHQNVDSTKKLKIDEEEEEIDVYTENDLGNYQSKIKVEFEREPSLVVSESYTDSSFSNMAMVN